MTELNRIAERYIAAWNETDAAKRKALLDATFTGDISYADPVMQGDGHDGLGALIEGAQQKFAGFRFSLKGTPDGFADYIRFSWALGPAGAESVVEGTDVGVVKDGRLKMVRGFLDKVPG
ncbi:nuclear transport factor 2 family protein [Mesorhizobium sp. LHD-90]|uniref:nuclear transport factor 2 family protein n=1 Tax=Mesorhizobium sp. LHD-90 TaxID=3071414 RepID=UPI0027E1EEBE|nr:nuclear transport factor 2 family protein [Mesorhizobium sp. LHD-90]MDQ6437346.1 nuclear transport factor 2 family protein [Mesorhizobium sp. LHD-90]